MARTKHTFVLPPAIERHLASVAKLYDREARKDLQELIVNAEFRVEEGWAYDNWDGGTYGHALFLLLPEDLYLAIARQRDKLQKQICSDLNDLHNVQNEYFAEVFLEMKHDSDGHDWRKESGLIRIGHRVAPEATKRIWSESGYRVFLSHKAEEKKLAAELKARMRPFGVSAFVAHQDVHPTKKWQDEIENALASMNAFVAVMTEKFHQSNWTDQEVGYALCRGVPIIALRMGTDPYGFIGKFQALTCSAARAPKAILKILIKENRMIDAFIDAVGECETFDSGNELAELLPAIDMLNDDQVDRLIAAFNSSVQAQGSFGFNGSKPHRYGDGLPSHLKRITGRRFRIDSSGRIRSS